MSLAPLIYNRLSIGFISRGYVLGLYLAEKGTQLSGIFDYPEAAKSHDSRIIGTCLFIEIYLLLVNITCTDKTFFFQNLSTRKNLTQFNITNARGKVVHFCIYKTSFRLGEDIVATFDFSTAEVPCVQVITISQMCKPL